LDPAFHSRVSIALEYSDLSVESRVRVWRNLTTAAAKGFEQRRQGLSEPKKIRRGPASIVRAKAVVSIELIEAQAVQQVIEINLADINFEELAQKPLNGRQIKTCIRLACALAAERQEVMGRAHLEETATMVSARA
jgi:hypothetical protein